MNIIESPLESLAFDYVSFGIFTVVNNLWTWVAVITAAVSFWRIRNAGAASYFVRIDQKSRIGRNQNGSPPLPEIPPTEVADSCIKPPPSVPAAASCTSPSACDSDENGTTKGKFTLYYYEEEAEDDRETTAAVKERLDDCSYGCEKGCMESWERVIMRVRMEDMGWRRYQDTTVINGNVVRLWDDEWRRRDMYSSNCAVW